MRENPGLTSRLDEALADAYEGARDAAAREASLPTRTFPIALPFAFSDVTERPILWPGDEA